MDEDTFARVHRVLGEPNRIQILSAIRKLNPSCGVACSTILREMSISQSTFSHHIAELVKAGLVNERKEGRFLMLSVNENQVKMYLDELSGKML